ncbi:MAG: HAMP domain-containing sensor histidine kinase [Lapillicoccus sp.]
MAMIVMLTTLTCLAAAFLGAVALRLVRARSLKWSVVVAALVPLIAVSASVVLNVQLMFISAHDSTAVSVALACATVIGILLSLLLSRRVASGSRQLTDALRDLSSPDSVLREVRQVSAPAEITALSTELEATRERLDAAQRRARALEDSRRELVAFMSHDLRTPLSGLRALAEGLEDGVIDDQPAALRQMRQTVDRMNGLVGDLFELSRLHAGPAADPAPLAMVSLVEVAHDVVGELRAHAAQRGVELRLDAAATDDRLAVRGSSDELTRALTNLVGNAIRHTDSGGMVVLTADRQSDGRIRMAVTDGCGGIPPGHLDRLFDVGWRAAPERGTQDAGAGLGLAIAKGVVEAHRGSIGVENVPGGCRFDVVLPAES